MPRGKEGAKILLTMEEYLMEMGTVTPSSSIVLLLHPAIGKYCTTVGCPVQVA